MIFISHSWKNKPAARKVVEALAIQGIPAWLDERQLEGGSEIMPSLRQAIAESDIYLYFVSEHSNQSDWCQNELKFALSLEQTRKLAIIPVTLEDTSTPLPELLTGRLSKSLDPIVGGANKLAHELREYAGYNSIPTNTKITATVRISENRIYHTIEPFRRAGIPSKSLNIIFLNDSYDDVASNYWSLSEVKFPILATPAEKAHEIIDYFHNQARRIIPELNRVCRLYLDTEGGVQATYFDRGHERALLVMVHRLCWISEYLRRLREGDTIDRAFADSKYLPEPFDAHLCDFLIGDVPIGSARAPHHGHPFHHNIEKISPWGMTCPASDISPNDLGLIIGNQLSLLFLNETQSSIELPNPATLKYGLA